MPRCLVRAQNMLDSALPTDASTPYPTLSHRVPWRLKEFILKWNGNWKKLLFSYGKNLIKRFFFSWLVFMTAARNAFSSQFVVHLIKQISLLDLISSPPCAFVLLKPFSTFVNLSDIEKNRQPINVESCNPWDVHDSFNWDGLVPSQMFPFSRYHCVLKLGIIIAL